MARRSNVEQLVFPGADLADVLARMDELAATADGTHWINLGPAVDEGDVPTGSPMFAIFSARGPIIPVATWIPGYRTTKGYVHTSVGIMHPTGRSAIDRLATRGAPAPSDWVIEQDHPKRGLILRVPPATSVREVLAAMLRMTATLTPFPFDDEWLATIH